MVQTTMNGGRAMQVVVVKSSGLMSRILRLLFGIKKTQENA